jgi:hypothetical protein
MRRVAVSVIFALSLSSGLAMASAVLAADKVPAADDARCKGYGLAPESPAYAKCIADLKRDHRAGRWGSSNSSLSDEVKARSDETYAWSKAIMDQQAAQAQANIDATNAQIAAQQAAAQQQGMEAMQSTLPH